MHTGRSYKLPEFLHWTRYKIYVLSVLGAVPVLLYQCAGFKWLALPWSFVAFLGTATAFIVGFKNTQTYSRTMEAQQVWTAIVGGSRAWGIMSRDFVNDPAHTRTLAARHFAWLTALRYQMREPRPWESTHKSHYAEYRRLYSIPEAESPLRGQLAKYLPEAEVAAVLETKNPAAQLLAIQGRSIKEMYDARQILINHFTDMQKAVREFCDQQSRSERIKNFPYPRQYAIVNTIFVRFFCLFLPFGMLREFDHLGDSVPGFMHGNMVWLVIPFSVIISWMYVSLEQVGESTENPFEGSANDVPISQACRAVEVDVREMLGEAELPSLLQPRNDIVL
jgi:putative membrane protein